MMKQLLVAFLLVASVGLAQPLPPMPIPVKVLTYGYSGGIAVTATNQRTLETVVQYTDQNGETIIEWANTVQKYQNGDIFGVKVLDKVKTVYAPDVPILVYDFVSSCPDVQYPTPTPYIIECPTPIPSEVCSISKELTYGEQLVQQNSECNLDIKAPAFPTTETMIGFIVTMTATLGITLKLTRGKDMHLHKGIKGYHSRWTVHQNDKIKHPKGCYDAEQGYKKGEDGAYYFDKCPSGQHK